MNKAYKFYAIFIEDTFRNILVDLIRIYNIELDPIATLRRLNQIHSIRIVSKQDKFPPLVSPCIQLSLVNERLQTLRIFWIFSMRNDINFITA